MKQLGQAQHDPSLCTMRSNTCASTKECNTHRYRPYQVVHTGPPTDRYVDRSPLGDTTDWGCFRLKKREKKNLEKLLLFARAIHRSRAKNRPCNPSPLGDFFSRAGRRNVSPRREE
ncbi:hypothetical protein BHE74_00011362 [Ensete ventricosum]|nr:hypothetical protein BHE74_00011362 [Ensete ventricosum]